MKTVSHTKFGPPEELQLIDKEKPVPRNNEVLIKVHYVTVTSSDCNIRNFTFVPKLFMLPAKLFMFGVFKPRKQELGVEMTGTVEAVGRDVKRFKAGDPVFGSPEPAFNTYAEYVCMPEDRSITIKPSNLSFEEVASLTLAGTTALHYLKTLGNIQKDQKILINGASGAIGTYAVQLAKYFGAEVTGVCSTSNIEPVKSLGADHVIDYTQQDITRLDDSFDIIFDVVGKLNFSKSKHLLEPQGIFLVNLIEAHDILPLMTTAKSKGKKLRGGVAVSTVKDLDFLKGLMEKGKLKSVIDRTFAFQDIAKAFRYVEQGHKKGNVLVKVG